MIKYRVVVDTISTEFASIEAANAFASANNTTAEEITYEPLVLTPPIKDVTPRQMRQALVLSGVSMDSIETALDSLSEPTKSLAKIEWEYSIAFQRNRPLVAQMGAMLGWTSEQLDDLWRLAASLE